MNLRDVEVLSAYLDGQLSPSDASRLEARLSTDAQLKAALEDLRGTRALLRKLPQRHAPRNFRLTPKMAGIKPPEPRAYPAFRYATALAALLFVTAVALNAVVPFAASRMAPAAAPAYGMGGGGGGGAGGDGGLGGGPSESQPSGATLAAPQAPFAALAATATAEGTLSITAATEEPQVQDTLRAESTEAAGKTAPVEPPARPPAPQQPASGQPVPLLWIVAFGAVMLLCGVAAWLLRTGSDRRIRSRWNHK